MASDVKYLLVMRHAKSDWGDANTPDHSRPLNARGRAAAEKMARWLAQQGTIPERILCSSSYRTCETKERMLDVWARVHPEVMVEVEIMKDLYHADPETLLRAIRTEADEARCVMVLAHNPGVSQFAGRLAGFTEHFPTATIARFRLPQEVAWYQLGWKSGLQLDVLARPKELPDE